MQPKRSSPQYETQYKQIYRHLDYFLDRAIERGEEYTSEELRQLLFAETGYMLREETIHAVMKKYRKSHGISPIVEVFRINEEYYERLRPRVKPPKIYARRNKED